MIANDVDSCCVSGSGVVDVFVKYARITCVGTIYLVKSLIVASGQKQAGSFSRADMSQFFLKTNKKWLRMHAGISGTVVLRTLSIQ